MRSSWREADPQVRVVIIRSSGRSFSSGYGYVAEDVEEGDFAQDGSIEDDVTAMIGLGSGWGRIWDCPIPVIAQVHGNCLAGGTDLALHCDVVVAAEDARIGFPPVRSMGVPPTNMWIYNVGPQWTKRLLLTGDTVSGLEAKDIGLVVATAPADELDQVVLDLASRMALIGRDLLIGNKRVVNMGVELMGRSQLQKFAAMSDAIGHRAPEALPSQSGSVRSACAKPCASATTPSASRPRHDRLREPLTVDGRPAWGQAAAAARMVQGRHDTPAIHARPGSIVHLGGCPLEPAPDHHRRRGAPRLGRALAAARRHRRSPPARCRGHLEVAVDRFSSGNQLYDRELKRRIDARHYPLILGKITGVADTETAAATGSREICPFHGEDALVRTRHDHRSDATGPPSR